MWDLRHTHIHLFNGPLSGTTRVSRYQKGKTNLDFTEARDSEWQWHQLGRMQVCTSLQTTMPSPHHSVFYRPDALPATQPTASKQVKSFETHLKYLPSTTRDLRLKWKYWYKSPKWNGSSIRSIMHVTYLHNVEHLVRCEITCKHVHTTRVHSKFHIRFHSTVTVCPACLQCFDAVGWATGRAPGL